MGEIPLGSAYNILTLKQGVEASLLISEGNFGNSDLFCSGGCF